MVLRQRACFLCLDTFWGKEENVCLECKEISLYFHLNVARSEKSARSEIIVVILK